MWAHRTRRAPAPIGLLLLGTQIMSVGIYNIPPVTFCLIAAQVVIYIEMIAQICACFPSANAVCISTYLLLYHRQWQRLFLSAFYHADDMHLYFNMVSLLWKGSMLEKRFQSMYFVFLVAVFTLATSLTYVVLNMFLDTVLDDHSYSTSCAVGFSGVLFAMKVLTTHYTPPGLHYALGFVPVPSRWIYWAELVLISVLYPNISFTGHLAGIIVGLLYIHGPLKNLMDMFMSPEPMFTQTRVYYRRMYPRSSVNISYNNTENSFDDSEMTEEEQIERATENSIRDASPRSQTGSDTEYPDLEELRQRRLNRYN